MLNYKLELKNAWKYLLLFLGIIGIFIVLMLLVSSFSSSWIKEKLIVSGDFFKITRRGDQTVLTFFLHDSDVWTDNLMLNTAFSIDNTNPWYSILAGRRNFNPLVNTTTLPDQIGGLVPSSSSGYDLLSNLKGEITEAVTYTRYWHGYLVLLRPELIFFSYYELMILHTLIYVSLSVYISYLLYKKFDKKIMFSFIIAMITSGLVVGVCLEYFYVYLLMFIGIIYLIKKDFKVNYIAYFLIIGSVTNFIDFLTAPLITLLYPLVLIELNKIKNNEKRTVKQELLFMLTLTCVWGFGYAFTWISKWLLWTVSYGGLEGLKRIIEQMLFRGATGTMSAEDYRLCTTLLFTEPYAIPIFIILGIWIIEKFFKHKKMLINKKEHNLFLLFLCIIPFIYLIILKNQVIWHCMFTYRNFIPISFIITILFFQNITFQEREYIDDNKNQESISE